MGSSRANETANYSSMNGTPGRPRNTSHKGEGNGNGRHFTEGFQREIWRSFLGGDRGHTGRTTAKAGDVTEVTSCPR